MENYLQHFKVLPLYYSKNRPAYITLLKIRRGASFKPYAWVDNIQRNGKLSVTLTPLNPPVTRSEIRAALVQLTGDPEGKQSSLESYLEQYALTQLQERERRFQSRGTSYLASPEAINDSIWLHRPAIAHPHVLAALELAKETDYLPQSLYPDEGLPERPEAWNWSQWTPPAGLDPLLRQFVTNKYPLELHQLLMDESRIPWNIFHDKRRTKSPRTQLKYLLEVVTAHEVRTQDSYYIEHPFPLKGYTPEQFARLPASRQVQLVAQCQTWFSEHTLITLGTHEGEILDDWPTDAEEILPYCVAYSAERGQVVPHATPLVSTTGQLANYLQTI